jgi:hypothetical protein
MIFRGLMGLTLAVALLAGAAVAAVVDNGPPYTSDQFEVISQERFPESFKTNLAKWWAKAPPYLKARILAAPSDRWWPIILCNYQGFKPESNGADSAATCENNWYKNSQRGKQQWSADGHYIEPTQACLSRNKRTQWGELICD